MAIADLFETMQEASLPGLWSKGVALTRTQSVVADKVADDEIIVRVLVKDKPVSPKVTLWPNDDDWFCDCGDRNDVCQHAAAAVIAAKNGQLKAPEAGGSGVAVQAAPHVRYRFKRHPEKGLVLERYIVAGDKVEPLTQSLVSLVGGIQSGRVAAKNIAASKSDFAVDGLISNRAPLAMLLSMLKECSNIFLEDQPIEISSIKLGLKARVSDEGSGFRLQGVEEQGPVELFAAAGVALSAGKLRPFDSVQLSSEERQWLSVEGRHFAAAEAPRLATEIIPLLSKKAHVSIETSRLPQLVSEQPRIVLRLESHAEGSLSVVPLLVYGDPAIAEVAEDRLVPLDSKRIPARDLGAEKNLVRRLQSELHLTVGRLVRFEGAAAVEFARKSRDWQTTGRRLEQFAARVSLEPRFEIFDDGGFRLSFVAEGGMGAPDGEADAQKVFQAWQSGIDHVPLIGGGFAKLPADWLGRFGPQIEELLRAKQRSSDGRLPRHFVPELATLAAELGASVPDHFKQLKETLERFEGIGEARLPRDLKAELRDYQRKGVNWLCFLREQGLGALLADDMGLGKTLQALCALKGRTLIVAPTSVLSAWTSQLAQFRPGLSVCVYHGPARALDKHADVVLTTYAILRLDRERLCAEAWDTLVLDEAQTIKNAASQVAQAAHALNGRFRIALSGTPVENRLDDLWSQLQFTNPGLLGSLSEFQERFAQPIARGQNDAAALLKRRIRPFLLRRLKRDVAPELPPRTETVLHCELSEAESSFYSALLAATRAEVVRELESAQSGAVMRALELLLRLRQACCSPRLVPGHQPQNVVSSKISLLIEMLTESLENGHRALVFSQWTSLLDLIEPELARAGMTFSRLDGTTRDREKVVREFQSPTGPSVMLLSLKAGGVGITLTAADHIFLMDPWWNPAVEDQAADRAHRIGQTNPVLVQRLVAKDTVEDRILLLQKKKLELAGSVLSDGSASVSLTREDLLDLLA